MVLYAYLCENNNPGNRPKNIFIIYKLIWNPFSSSLFSIHPFDHHVEHQLLTYCDYLRTGLIYDTYIVIS